MEQSGNKIFAKGKVDLSAKNMTNTENVQRNAEEVKKKLEIKAQEAGSHATFRVLKLTSGIRAGEVVVRKYKDDSGIDYVIKKGGDSNG